MRACPRCTFPLTPYRHHDPALGQQVGLDHCHRCGGSFLDPGVATSAFGPGAEPSVWKESHATRGPAASRLRCPADGQQLEAYYIKFEGPEVEVDTCAHCRGMWVDRHEGGMIQQIVAHAETVAYRKREGLDKPGLLAYVFQLATAMPIEVWNPVRRTPWVVYSLIGLLILIFLGEVYGAFVFGDGRLMMIPAQLQRGEHLWTIITSGFLHAGWLHLLGNLYFLWIFGDNVEDAVGHGRFIFIYLVCLVGGSLGHLVFNLDSGIPLLGASGAISGLMGAYWALFPRVKVWMVILFIRFRLGIGWYIGFWAALQALHAAAGTGGTAWFAHLGGFVTGLAIGLALKPGTERELTAIHQV